MCFFKKSGTFHDSSFFTPHYNYNIDLQVTVVVVFLVCHSVKLFISGYEVYELVKRNVAEGGDPEEDEVPIRLTMNVTNGTSTDEMGEENVQQRYLQFSSIT